MDHGASGETCGDSASPVGAEGQYGKCLARAPTPASVTDLVEQVTEQTELERLARRMYEETFDLMKDPRLGKVARGKVTLLYGPPMVRPDIALVSFQGGAADRSPSRRSWPERLLYLDDAFDFGKVLRDQFATAGLFETLEERTVAMAACFPEAPAGEAGLWSVRGGPRAEWREFSSTWVRRMLAVMEPRAVLVIGKKASDSLGLSAFWRDAIYRNSDRHMVFGRAEIAGCPSVFCHHLSQGWDRPGVQRCLDEIKRIVRDRA